MRAGVRRANEERVGGAMATVSLVQGNGKGRVSLDPVFQSLRSGLQGDVLLPGLPFANGGGLDPQNLFRLTQNVAPA
jgi:hypothetical protein